MIFTSSLSFREERAWHSLSFKFNVQCYTLCKMEGYVSMFLIKILWTDWTGQCDRIRVPDWWRWHWYGHSWVSQYCYSSTYCGHHYMRVSWVSESSVVCSFVSTRNVSTLFTLCYHMTHYLRSVISRTYCRVYHQLGAGKEWMLEWGERISYFRMQLMWSVVSLFWIISFSVLLPLL